MVSVYVCPHVRPSTCAPICVSYPYLCVLICLICVSLYVCPYLCVLICVSLPMCPYMCVLLCVSLPMCLYMCVLICVSLYVYKAVGKVEDDMQQRKAKLTTRLNLIEETHKEQV